MEYLIVNIAEEEVTVVRFDVSGHSASLGGAASFPLDGGTTLADVAAKIAAGISGAPRVIVCLPTAMFAQRIVELPLRDLRKVREILPAHLQGEIALSADEAVFDALPAADGSYLALWAKRTEVAQVIDLFRAAGCEPQMVTSAPFAWPALPGVYDDCAVCDGSALVTVAGGRLAFVRALDCADPQQQLRATLSAMELSGTRLPQQLLVFGEQAAVLAGMAGLSLNVEQVLLPDNLVTTFKTEGAFQQLAGLYAVARACHDGALPDFRRGDLAWTTGDSRLRKKMILTAILLVMAIILLFVSKGLQYRAARIDIASLNASISSLYREIFPSRTKAVDELSEVKGEIRKLTGSETSSSVLDVLKQIADSKGTAINGLFEAELEGSILRVKGDARSAQSVNDFKAALSSLMASIEVGEIKSRPDGSVSFSLSGTLKEGAK